MLGPVPISVIPSRKYLVWDDLYTTDTEVLEKVRRYNDSDQKAARLFVQMNSKIDFCLDPEKYDVRVSLKSRAVDPYFQDGRGRKRLSEADPTWGTTVKAELVPKEYFIRFI